MDAREPDPATTRKAREDQQRADAARTTDAQQAWRDQAEEIEHGMADAVERAAAMGDHVEPSTLPPERRPHPARPDTDDGR